MSRVTREYILEPKLDEGTTGNESAPGEDAEWVEKRPTLIQEEEVQVSLAGKPAVENKVSLPLDALEVTQPLNSQGLSHAQPKASTNASLVLKVALVVVVVPDNHSLTNDLLWLVVVIGHDILGVAVVVGHYSLNDTLFLDLLHFLDPLVVCRGGSGSNSHKQEKRKTNHGKSPSLLG
jgi:hypothetical protein